jgi:hypothetical protein
VLADLVDLHDMGMFQLGGGLGLAPEASAFVRAGLGGAQEQLDCDQAIEADLPRLVDDTHSPAPQLLQDDIPGGIEGRSERYRARNFGPCLESSQEEIRDVRETTEVLVGIEVGLAGLAERVFSGDQPDQDRGVGCQHREAGEIILDPRAFAGFQAKLEFTLDEFDKEVGIALGREAALDARAVALLPGSLETLEDLLAFLPAGQGKQLLVFVGGRHDDSRRSTTEEVLSARRERSIPRRVFVAHPL